MGLDFALVVILCLSSLTVIENTKSNPTHLPHQQNGRQWYIFAHRPQGGSQEKHTSEKYSSLMIQKDIA